MQNPLQALQNMIDQGFQPCRRLIWLGFGFLPPKQNAIAIHPMLLPNDIQSKAVCGLDVILLFKGYSIQYGPLKRLCGSLYNACPRRLQIYDLDYKKTAYLKLGSIT